MNSTGICDQCAQTTDTLQPGGTTGDSLFCKQCRDFHERALQAAVAAMDEYVVEVDASADYYDLACVAIQAYCEFTGEEKEMI